MFFSFFLVFRISFALDFNSAYSRRITEWRKNLYLVIKKRMTCGNKKRNPSLSLCLLYFNSIRNDRSEQAMTIILSHLIEKNGSAMRTARLRWDGRTKDGVRDCLESRAERQNQIAVNPQIAISIQALRFNDEANEDLCSIHKKSRLTKNENRRIIIFLMVFRSLKQSKAWRSKRSCRHQLNNIFSTQLPSMNNSV